MFCLQGNQLYLALIFTVVEVWSWTHSSLLVRFQTSQKEVVNRGRASLDHRRITRFMNEIFRDLDCLSELEGLLGDRNKLFYEHTCTHEGLQFSKLIVLPWVMLITCSTQWLRSRILKHSCWQYRGLSNYTLLKHCRESMEGLPCVPKKWRHAEEERLTEKKLLLQMALQKVAARWLDGKHSSVTSFVRQEIISVRKNNSPWSHF